MMKKSLTLLFTLFSPVIATNWNTSYHNLSTGQFKVAESHLASMQLKGNEKILDVGCGTGKSSQLYALHVPHGIVLGIDASANLIEFAQKEYNHIENVKFQVTDVSQLHINQEFDIAYSFFCLHWVSDKQRALTAIARALKPGGKAYLYIAVESEIMSITSSYIHKIVEMYPEWKPYITHPIIESGAVWLSRAQQAGFHIDTWKVVKKERLFKTKLEHAEYVYTLGITSLPEVDHKKCIDRLIDQLYAYYGIEDNEPFLRKTNILILQLVKK